MNETKRLIFKVDRLKKKHGSLEALNVKKLEIHPGTIYALVGPPGCGKTTLLEILSGSQKQTSGELYFENLAYETNWFGKIKKHDEIFYNYGFDEFSSRSTVSNVIGKMYGKKANTIMKRHFNSPKSKHLWKRSISSLTKGELHWVGMVLSLESDPRVLLIDDYGVHLTNEMEQEFRNQLKRMNRTLGTTIIVSSPSEAIVKNFASVIIFMDNGHISKIRSKSNRLGGPRRQVRRKNYNQKKKTSNNRGPGNRSSGNRGQKRDDKQSSGNRSQGSNSRSAGNRGQKGDDKQSSDNMSQGSNSRSSGNRDQKRDDKQPSGERPNSSNSRSSVNRDQKNDEKRNSGNRSKGWNSRSSRNRDQKVDEQKYSRDNLQTQVNSPASPQSVSIKNDQNNDRKKHSEIKSEKSADQPSKKEEKIENSK